MNKVMNKVCATCEGRTITTEFDDNEGIIAVPCMDCVMDWNINDGTIGWDLVVDDVNYEQD
jgi:hypothetical protein